MRGLGRCREHWWSCRCLIGRGGNSSRKIFQVQAPRIRCSEGCEDSGLHTRKSWTCRGRRYSPGRERSLHASTSSQEAAEERNTPPMRSRMEIAAGVAERAAVQAVLAVRVCRIQLARWQVRDTFAVGTGDDGSTSDDELLVIAIRT